MKFDIKVGNVGSVDQTDAWVLAFDPKSSLEVRRALIGEFRKEIVAHPAHMDDARWKACRWLDEVGLPRDMTVAFVMTQGYYKAQRDAYSYLNTKSKIAERFVFIGYSSGKYHRREFSDGSRMWGNVYMPEDDLMLLKNKSTSPLLLLDVDKVSGAAYAGIGNALKKQLNYTGTIYQRNGDSVERWTGHCTDSSISLNPPIYTERGGPITTRYSPAVDPNPPEYIDKLEPVEVKVLAKAPGRKRLFIR